MASTVIAYVLTLPDRERAYAQQYAAYLTGLRYFPPADRNLAEGRRAEIEARIMALLQAA